MKTPLPPLFPRIRQSFYATGFEPPPGPPGSLFFFAKDWFPTVKGAPMYEQLAMNWYHAERAVTDPSWSDITEARREQIRKRVKDILDGEVRRSECSKGDLAIWHGRYRVPAMPEWFRERAEAQAAERLAGHTRRGGPRPVPPLKDYHLFGTYDCLEVDAECSERTYLFANRNIGHAFKSNLQVAGILAPYGEAVVTGWHASTEADSDLVGVLEDVFDRAMASLVVGDRELSRTPLLELWREPRPIVVDVMERQSFRAEIAFEAEALKRLKKALLGRDYERGLFRIYLHVEGWRTRELQ